ncbi:RHS repeat-associated core domain-containing protein [Pseudomonas alloputida]|uniref:RHS repeat-associated core domain-containing protein n=1 Tax=Pseudomonas TaxID=286 RepID=UPI003EF062AC
MALGISSTFSYGPYGYVFSTSDGMPILGFNGQPWIYEGACTLGNGYRVYDFRLMRFVRPDEHSPFGRGGVNCYAYCGGDPVNHVDPDRRFPTSARTFNFFRGVSTFVRPFFASARPSNQSRPGKFNVLLKLVDAQSEYYTMGSYMAFPYEVAPPSYRRSVGKFGIVSVPAPDYSTVPREGQKTMAINLGGRRNEFNSSGADVSFEYVRSAKRRKLERIFSDYAFYASATPMQLDRASKISEGFKLDDVATAIRRVNNI